MGGQLFYCAIPLWNYTIEVREQEPNSMAALLKDLKELLDSVPDLNTVYGDLDDPDYSQQHDAFKILFSDSNLVYDVLFDKIARVVKDKRPGDRFSMCSVGCGDGERDYHILSRLAAEFPKVVIEYVGIDVNETSCEKARKRFANLARCTQTVIAGDFMRVESTKSHFDWIQLSHVHYYFEDLAGLVKKAVSLCDPNHGRVGILSLSPCPPLKMMDLFYQRNANHPLWDTSDLISVLKDLDLEFNVDELKTKLTVTRCIEEEFQTPFAKCALNFLCHTKLDLYPAEVARSCVDYYKETVYGKAGEYYVDYPVDALVIHSVNENEIL